MVVRYYLRALIMPARRRATRRSTRKAARKSAAKRPLGYAFLPAAFKGKVKFLSPAAMKKVNSIRSSHGSKKKPRCGIGWHKNGLPYCINNGCDHNCSIIMTMDGVKCACLGKLPIK